MKGLSIRDIAKDCRVDKNTVAKYIKQYFGPSINKKNTTPKIIPLSGHVSLPYDATNYSTNKWKESSQDKNYYRYQINNHSPQNQINQNNFQHTQDQEKPNFEIMELNKLIEQIKEDNKNYENYKKFMGEIDELIQKLIKNKVDKKREADIFKLKLQMDRSEKNSKI